MNPPMRLLLLSTFLSGVIRRTQSVVDPFDLRHYDPKTKTMRAVDSVNANPLVDKQACADCLRYIENYCEATVMDKLHDRPMYKTSDDLRNTATLQTYMKRFIKLLIIKAGLKETKIGHNGQEAVISIKLWPKHLEILNDFGESGDPRLLRDINEILSKQMSSYYPPLCPGDYIQKIYEAKEFFSQSTFIVLGIFCMAAVFFYNVFVLKQIRIAFLSLLSTIFFAGYFWTYWKLYEETISDIRRVTSHGSYQDCYPRTETFFWFFSYTVPADDAKCKELYDAQNVSPLARLTPTIVFYKTIEVFWSGPLSGLSTVVVTLYKDLSYYSPWYIKWTILPLVLIFMGVVLIILIAFLSGKRFKLSHPVFGAIELDTDVNYKQQTCIKQSETAFKVVKSSSGSNSNLSCLTCGTNFVQITTQQVIATRTVVESSDKTEPDGVFPPTNTSAGARPITTGLERLNYLSSFIRSILSPRRQITDTLPAITNGQRHKDENIMLNAEFSTPTEGFDNLVTLEDCSDSEDKDKENQIIVDCRSQKYPVSSDTRFSNLKSHGYVALLSPSSSAPTSSRGGENLGSKEKFFEDITFTLSPDPKEKRYIPIVVKPGAGEPFINSKPASPREENSNIIKKRYFAKSNERIKKQLFFRQASAKLFAEPISSSQAVESVIKHNKRIYWSSGERKLSI